MSIINDAIKRARKEFSASKDEKEHFLNVELANEPEKKRSDFTVVVLALLVFVAGSVFLYKNMTRFTAKPSSAIVESEMQPNQYSAVEEDLRKASRILKVETAFNLNGIVCDESGKWAIIDNKIVNEGDIVSGGQITSISKDFVKIKKINGSETVLNLK